MATCTSQLVEFVWRDFQSSGPCHKVFLIKLGPNNYLKVSNVNRSEPRGFHGHSKLTNFWAFWHFWSFFEPDFNKINNLKNSMFRINSIRAFDWCMNCYIMVKFFFSFFWWKEGTLIKKKLRFFFFIYDNSYTNRKLFLLLY